MKNQSTRFTAVLITAAMAVSMLAGCGAAQSSSTTAAAKAAGSAAAGTSAASAGTKAAAAGTKAAAASGLSFSVCCGSEDALSINTAKAKTIEGISACRHLYEGLYKLDEKGNVVLGQAAKDDISSDGLTRTFTLRDDIKWSDGTAVKAADFIYGWKYLKECKEDYASLMDIVKEAKATDDKTLVVTLKFACSYLPSILAFPSAYPVREDIVTKYADSYATDPDKTVYNGAYKVTSWTHQQSLVMAARDDYYNAKAITAKQVTWNLMTDTSTMLASYKSGDIIYSDSYPEEQAESMKDKGLNFAPGYNTYCVMFNVGKKGPEALKDAKVRKALTLAIDRSRIAKMRNLNDELANTYTPTGLKNKEGKDFTTTVTPWFDNDKYKENCEEAKKLFAEAGYGDSKKFPAMKYIVNNAGRKEVAEAVVSDWKEVLGIDSVTVETVDGFFNQRSSQEYDFAYYGWYMDYPDISNMLYTMTTGSSNSGYENKDYDTAYNAAISAKDEATTWKSYAKCEDLLAKDMPVAPLLHSQNSYLFDSSKYDGLVYYCGNSYFGYVHQK